MTTLEDVNRLKLASYRIQLFDNWKLLAIGAHDLSYGHEVEITFENVQHINCDIEFYDPVFQQLGACPCGCSAIRIGISADKGDFEIIAMNFDITLGIVYHYKRGTLKSGERIAPWIE